MAFIRFGKNNLNSTIVCNASPIKSLRVLETEKKTYFSTYNNIHSTWTKEKKQQQYDEKRVSKCIK